MSDRRTCKSGLFCLALTVLAAASCAGIQSAISLQGKRLALQVDPGSTLIEVLPEQVKLWGAEIVATERQSDAVLKIEQYKCMQTPLAVAGRSARATSYELHCHARFILTDDTDDWIVRDSISVRDSFLYDSGSSAVTQFPARGNELRRLHGALAEEAALSILQQVAILLAARNNE